MQLLLNFMKIKKKKIEIIIRPACSNVDLTEFESHYLVQTPTGNLLIPQSQGKENNCFISHDSILEIIFSRETKKCL